MDSRQQEVLSVQKKLTTVQQEKDTLQQEFECLVRLRLFFHVHCLLMYRLCNCFTDSFFIQMCFPPQKQKLSESTEEQTKSEKTMQGSLYIRFFVLPSLFPTISSFLILKSIWSLKCNFFLFVETREKLSKKEEQCTSLTTESEALRSQLAGESFQPHSYVKCLSFSLSLALKKTHLILT